MDREKVIEDLVEHIESTLAVCDEFADGIPLDLLQYTVHLLKEQDAKWVEDKRDEHCRLIKCSNCGLTFIVGNNIPYDEWIEDRNYCRRCGARMVKRND